MKINKAGKLISPSSYTNVYENEAYFVSRNYPYIIKWDQIANELKIISKIPKCKQIMWSFSKIYKFDNILLCVPDTEETIVFYDLIEKKFDFLNMRDFGIRRQNFLYGWNFRDCFFVDNILYMVSKPERKIILLDMKEHIICDYYEIPYIKYNDNFTFDNCFDGKQYIYMTVQSENKIISFDIYTKEFQEHYIECELSGFTSISYDGKLCWIGGVEPVIVKWNPVSNESEILRKLPEEFQIFKINNAEKNIKWTRYENFNIREFNYTFSFSCFDKKNQRIWILPHHSNGIICINTEKSNIDFLQLYDYKTFELNKNSAVECGSFILACICDECLWFYSENDGYFYKIDCKTKKVETISLTISDEDVYCMMRDLMKSGDTIGEYDFFDLKDFLSVDYLKNDNKDKDIKIGEKIYEKMLESI